MFTQVGEAVRAGAGGVLGGARPAVVLGTGNSQSGRLLNGYLSGYYAKQLGVFDGFAPSAMTVQPPVPTIWMNSQSETMGAASRADTKLLRVWEVEGGRTTPTTTRSRRRSWRGRRTTPPVSGGPARRSWAR